MELLTDSLCVLHKHTSFNIQPEQYAIVGHHLIETLRELAPDAFTPDVEEATAAYGQLADIFIKVESELYQQRAAVKEAGLASEPFLSSQKRPNPNS